MQKLIAYSYSKAKFLLEASINPCIEMKFYISPALVFGRTIGRSNFKEYLTKDLLPLKYNHLLYLRSDVKSKHLPNMFLRFFFVRPLKRFISIFALDSRCALLSYSFFFFCFYSDVAFRELLMKHNILLFSYFLLRNHFDGKYLN